MDLQKKDAVQRKNIQLLFLIAVAIVPFSTILINTLNSDIGVFLSQKYMMIPSMLFLGSALTQRLTSLAKRCLLLSFVAAMWFMIVQAQHHLAEMETLDIGLFAAAYLTAFPFAAVTEEGKRASGLKWTGWIYMGFSLLMVVLTLALYMDILPGVLAPHVYWDGVRARIFWHPNGSSFVLLMGLGFSLYFMTQAEKKWKKWIMVILAVLQFWTIVLTNSRTTIFLACALMSGTLFFLIWKGSWKQFLAGAAAALVLMVILLCGYKAVFDLHNEIQIQKVLEQSQSQDEERTQRITYNEETGEIVIIGSHTSSQGDLSKDMKSLNGRTGIWKAAFQCLKDNPDLRIWGTAYVNAEVSYRNSFTVFNCHNSWIQMMLLMGIPGLLIALVYTIIAVWNVCLIMLQKNVDIGRKIIAMMVVCLLSASVLEVYIFTGEELSNSENFLFFLCTGYLVQWNRKASETE